MKIFKNRKYLVIFLVILAAHIFLQFYNFQSINTFGWDQVDNAWAAKNIIVDHKMPLVGMVAKQNSGFYIGPAYYYLVAIFYGITNLDPIASGILAGLTSIFSFLTIWYITKKIFSESTALWGVFIYTVSHYLISQDRVQWPVNFIVPISYAIFYLLYLILQGKNKYIIPLGVLLGLSLQVHFTSVFYFLIVLCCLPFFTYNKSFFKNLAISIPLFFVFLIPNILYELHTKESSSKNLSVYISTYYHGFHLVRFIQLIQDAFIEFESVLFFPLLKILKFILIPVFFVLYLREHKERKRFMLCYLVILWFLIPWVAFTTYSGEISDYYFSMTLPLVVMVVAYISGSLFSSRYIVARIFVSLFWIYFAYTNIAAFFHYDTSSSLQTHRQNTDNKIKEGQIIQFQEGVPESYLYYLYQRNAKIKQ